MYKYNTVFFCLQFFSLYQIVHVLYSILETSIAFAKKRLECISYLKLVCLYITLIVLEA